MGATASGSTWDEVVAGRVGSAPCPPASGSPGSQRPRWRRALCALGHHPRTDLIAFVTSPEREAWTAFCLSCDRVIPWRALGAGAKLRLFHDQVVRQLESLRDGMIAPATAGALARRGEIPVDWQAFRSIRGPVLDVSELAEDEVAVANAPHGWTVLRRLRSNDFEACIVDAIRSGRIPSFGRRVW